MLCLLAYSLALSVNGSVFRNANMKLEVESLLVFQGSILQQ
jgi:hypothetical protein